MSDWLPVTKAHPCQICGRTDWCLAAPDGKAQLCNRVQSDRPAKGGGWLHGTPERAECPVARPTPQPAYDQPGFDCERWWGAGRFLLAQNTVSLNEWTDRLGLPAEALDWMGATTMLGMLCFPMHDGAGNVCGIRTRTPDGQKRAVTGSKAGVFLSTVHLDSPDVLICEGPTDAAAALALSFEPIGRPSCIGCERHVLDTLKRWGKDRATICADADGPGITGANKLADVLRAGRIAVRMVAPADGHKDLRDWYRAGATMAAVDAAWSQAEWRA